MINYHLNRIIIYSIVFIFQIFGLFGNLNLIILTYRKKNLQTKYGLILMILAVVHSFCLGFEYISMGFGIAICFGWIYLDQDIIPFCNPPSALTNDVNSIWYILMFTFSIFTLIFYVLSFGILRCKKYQSDSPKCLEKKAMLTLKFLIIIFLFVRFLSTFSMNILSFLGYDEEIVAMAKNYNIICSLVAYSQNAYVCYFRSSEYRQLFNEQLLIVFPRGKVFLKVSSSTRVVTSRSQKLQMSN
ncbi:unnamed protein product [Caenorhabditis angaria]|uniref:Uncharacterized protein n=1 Tax=Caenorhabditis angaria TaxID=860376 RepID=A0A9P1IR42_9PELO|nr:unnamed protein product [Caenorhabditis angaria]